MLKKNLTGSRRGEGIPTRKSRFHFKLGVECLSDHGVGVPVFLIAPWGMDVIRRALTWLDNLERRVGNALQGRRYAGNLRAAQRLRAVCREP
ncbi:protein of unknown function [Methylocaldum szegediense]|uniref:Uncharacterized protein n=1 Tax=Methylocaldum szegediense TaxID=73780 RepID=A0ABN8WW00_9GAMM|nr:protein of unknown function [Methylocaldum szegediense]